jgi:hypothetical protein
MNWKPFVTTFASAFVAVSGFCAEIGDSASAEKPKAQLQAEFYQQNTPYAGEVTRGIITAATNQFSFVIPNGFRKLAEVSGKTVTLTSTGRTASLTFRIFEHTVDGKIDLKPDGLRENVLGRFKEAKVVDEFPAYIESTNGPAFEVEWSGQVCKMTSRVAFVPYAGGHVEVIVQSPAAEFRSYDAAFASFLTMIRSSPIGTKLPMVEFLSEL